mgnify:FL=1
MKIFIAGHKGMVGSSIFKKAKNQKDFEIHIQEKNSLNLLNQTRVLEFFLIKKFDLVIDCAAKVGGIHSNNKYRAEFIYENLQIQNNLTNRMNPY